ncbi:recombinase family protein [Cronobacter sakazakii]|uniref:recombinase family protein n=4 Tax=Cronobacter sakazakii TaxID=28141 RepID=UPI003C12B819
MFPGKSFFSAHEVSTCKISGCLSYRILDSGPDGTQTTLTDIAQKGDVLLVEQVDRLSRLSGEDWNKLRSLINEKGVRVVALDLPTSHQLIQSGDEFTSRMLEALNGMMLDMLAAIARKDYTDRKRRQAQGIVKAKSDGKYKGRPEDTQRNERIAKLLQAGMSYSDVMETVNCSRATVAKVSKSLKEVV